MTEERTVEELRERERRADTKAKREAWMRENRDEASKKAIRVKVPNTPPTHGNVYIDCSGNIMGRSYSEHKKDSFEGDRTCGSCYLKRKAKERERLGRR